LSIFVPYFPNLEKVVVKKQLPKLLKGSVFGITTYYNPAGYSNKLENYRKFRDGLRRQGLPLATVELAFGDKPFALTQDDAEILLQYRTTTVLWHKERMFNAALQHLPVHCDKIVWLDADILFLDDQWVEKTSALLQEYAIIQPFSHAIRFPKGVDKPVRDDFDKISKGLSEYHGYVFSHKTAGKGIKVMNSGLVWAGRREIFDRCGFYDKLILGTGDRFMAGAFQGFRYLDDRQRFNQLMIEDQNRWISRVFELVQGSVYYQEGVIGHLFHGTMRNRQYHKRTHLLKKYEFDPSLDITADEQGVIWKWASGKKEFHREVTEYFHSRREEDDDSLVVRWYGMLVRKALALKSRLYHLWLRYK
jgi:hypothetical protein